MVWTTLFLLSSLTCDSRNIDLIRRYATLAQNRYSTRIPTPCRRLWCWCPRIFGRRHLPSKRAWKIFTLYWRCWCRFYEEKQFVVNFGTWMLNQNALWQLKSPQTKTRRTAKPLASKMAAVKKVGQENGEVGLLVEYLFCDFS